MAIIWVDSAATGLADGTSYINAYTTLSAALVTSVARDLVYMVSTHADAAGTFTVPDGVSVYSVTSAGVYQKSTTYNVNNTNDITIIGNGAFYGVGFSANDDIWVNDAAKFYDCNMRVDATISGYLALSSSVVGVGSREFYGGEIHLGGTGYVVRGGRYYLNYLLDGVVINATTTGPTYFCAINGARSLDIAIRNVNFDTGSVQTGLFNGNFDVNGRIEVHRCVIPAGFVIHNGTITEDAASIICTSMDVGDGYHYFYEKYWQGEISEDTAIYRTLGAKYDVTNGFSAEMISNSEAAFQYPLRFNLASQYINTTDYTTDITFTAHFAVDGSAVALNDDEFWIEVEYADGADNALGVTADNRSNPLATGAAPTIETALWENLSATNIQMSVSKTITIGTTAGTIASGVVKVKAYLGKASQVVFVCPQFDIS